MGTIAVAPTALPAVWSMDANAVLDALGVDAGRGLSADEVAARRRRHGPNRLRQVERVGNFAILVAQFRSIVILLLVLAAGVTLAFGDVIESLAIVAVIVINTAIGFVTELRAVRSIEALRRLGRVDTTVRRDGRVVQVPADALVPGDIVLIDSGDVISADLRLVESARLEADESTLTGESVPVAKHCDPLPDGTVLAERANQLFKGTSVTRGSGLAVVTGIGLDTELGRISELVLEAEASSTPLEQRLDALARRLVWITLAIALAVAGIGLLVGREFALAIEVAIALAVAAIPEGLPIVATIALARGMWRMSRRQALVSRLSAVETLGATNVILTDKTGTLTENQMTVTRLEVAGSSLELGGTGLEIAGELSRDDGAVDPDERVLATRMLEIAALCSNAAIESGDDEAAATAVGDPTEVALLIAAAKLGIRREALLQSWPEVAEEPFDPATRAMATFHRAGDRIVEAVKGAPEYILAACVACRDTAGDRALDDEGRRHWLERSHALAARGLRTLAIATRESDRMTGDAYSGLVLLGIVGVRDPARAGVRDALAACRASGIEVVMVTGDHAATARSIAEDLGLIAPDAGPDVVIDGRELPPDSMADARNRERFAGARVVARASPEQKLELIRLHQDRGNVVAMTGDGVNDAPALRKADIGVAMGRRGTQVAREAAAMILQDDRFATIVEAVAQGRAIYANIRKFVVYLLSCNISEILIVGLATLAGAPLPLLPLQILFLNLVTDVFPALALGVGEGAPGLMRRGPRPAGEPLLRSDHWRVILAWGILISLVVLASLAVAILALGFDTSRAVTVSFLTLALTQLWHVFNMRDDTRAVIRNEITRNRWVWAALALCLALTAGAVYVPGISTVLSLTDPGISGWALVLGMSLVPLLCAPLVAALAGRTHGNPQSPDADPD